MAHHHRYRHRRTFTQAQLNRVTFVRSMTILARKPRTPRICRIGQTYYANDLAIEQLKRECPPSPHMPLGMLGNPFAVAVERMPEWMEAALSKSATPSTEERNSR